MTIEPPGIRCGRCRRLRGFVPEPDEYRWPTKFRCEAFPDGIPDPIADSEVDHLEPFPGDNGLQYLERAPGTAPPGD